MKTLVRATNWVGDVVMSLPAVRALRTSFPEDELTVLARPWVAELYRLLPEVDRVLVEDPRGAHAGRVGRARLAAELREHAFDRAVILPTSFSTALAVHRAGVPERIGYRGELRSPLLTRAVPLRTRAGEHQVWKHLRLVVETGAAMPAHPDTSWSVSPRERDAGRGRLEEAGWRGETFAAAHVASFAHAAKRWPLASFARVFDQLAGERGLAFALLGSAAEGAVNAEASALARRARVLDLSGRSTLPEVLGILSHAALFLGNDSGIAHLAGAAGLPTVVVFGPTDPDATRPWDGPRPGGTPARIAVVRRPPLCAPCRFDVCPIDHVCMRGLEAERVAGAALSLAP